MNDPMLTGGAPTGPVLVVGADQRLACDLRQRDALRGVQIDHAADNDAALDRLRSAGVAVVVTDPATPLVDDLAFASEVQARRAGVKVIILAPVTHQPELIAALRAQVFACFSQPFDSSDLAAMIRGAIESGGCRDGIEVLSGLPSWLTLRATSRMVNAERLLRFMTEYRADVDEEERQALMTALREIVINAMEHGARFDPDQTVDVTAARTARAILFHVRDPGPGFRHEDLAHAAVAHSGAMAHLDRRQALGLRPGGFGILLTRGLVDELVYNERGNEVILVKYVDGPRRP